VTLHVTRSHTTTKDVASRRVFDSPHAFGGFAPLRELERSPRPPTPNPLATIGGGVLLLRGGRAGVGKREGKEGKWGRKIKGRGGKGRGLPPLYSSSDHGPVIGAARVPGSRRIIDKAAVASISCSDG